MRRCVYCGFPLQGGRPRDTCSEHADLPDLDSGWFGFLVVKYGVDRAFESRASRHRPRSVAAYLSAASSARRVVA